MTSSSCLAAAHVAATSARIRGIVLASPTASSRLAEVWGAPRIELGPPEHINEASGLGSWDGGWHLVQAFVAGTSR
jgi:predicted alpha/beta hydrolase family esterase